MDSKEELKAQIERNREIRAEENDRIKKVLKNSNNDKEMRELRDLREKMLTTTSKDDRRRKIIRGVLIACACVLIFAGVAVGLYFLLK